MNYNKSKHFMLAATVISVASLNSCKRIPDGENFFIKTKTSKLVGEWEIVDISDAEKAEDFYVDYEDYTVIFEFEKDGDFKFTYLEGKYSYSYLSDWEWSDEENNSITFDVFEEELEMEITKLTANKLWFEDEDGDEWKCERWED